MRVFSARYRLAPEHPFPAQREDAVAACGAITGEASIFLAGDSAGACIALWGLQGLDAPMRARIAGLVLLYGGYGLIESASIARYGTPENGLDSQTLAVMYRRLGDDVVWPAAFAGEITEPAYVLAAETDAVLDDSTGLFGRLAANPANLLTVVKGEDHGFFKRTGKDSVALKELENAAGWAAERLAQRSSKMQA